MYTIHIYRCVCITLLVRNFYHKIEVENILIFVILNIDTLIRWTPEKQIEAES